MRNAFAYRPLVAMALALAGALAWRVEPWTLLLALPGFAFRRTVAFALLGLLLGLWLAPAPAEPTLIRKFLKGIGTVATVPRVRTDRQTFDLTVGPNRDRSQLPLESELALGDQLEFEAIVRPLPDGLDDYPRLQGISGDATLLRHRVVVRAHPVLATANRWSHSFASFCDRYLPPPIANLTEALCLNLDGKLDDATKAQLVATGTVHIVSASGLHVYVIAAALTTLLSLLPIPRPIQLVLLAVMLTLYAIATGLNAPVVRSAFVAVLGSVAYLVRRDQDALSALALAAVAYLLLRPRGIFDIGFQLSFVTVGGLILFGPTEWQRPANGMALARDTLVSAARISWIAFAASAPLVAYHFGVLSLVSLLANGLIAVAVSAIVIGGLLAHALSFVWLALGVGMLQLVGALSGWVLIVVEWLGSVPMAQIAVPPIPGVAVALVYGLGVLTWRERLVQP